MTIGFRADLLHQNSVRAGYLDLDGCTVVDMLPRFDAQDNAVQYMSL